MRSVSRLLLGLSFALTTAACAQSTAPCVDPNTPANTTAATTTSASGASTAGSQMVAGVAPKRCSGEATPAPDGLIDDFEDGDTQLANQGGRDGYWWTAQDPNGSTMTPQQFATSDGGANSAKAAHFTGTTSSEGGAWGVSFGVNFLSQKAPYDGSRYAGISFKAKAGPNGTKNIRVKIGDINTHQDAGVCTGCWNHFGQDITLTEEWQEYKILFADTKQGDGWGAPRPPSITTDKLWSLDFAVGPGANYDIWVDDVRFLTCP